jgi:O-antigen ligase
MSSLDVRLDRYKPGVTAILLGLGVVLGALVSAQPSLLLLIAILVAGAVWGSVRNELAWWDLVVFVVAGVYVLEYGFVNIGVTGAVPLPLVDLIAVLLVARIGTWRGFRWPSSAPFVLAVALAADVAVRLVLDYPTYGVLAIRDATLGLELSFLLIGYWAIDTFGLARLIRVMSVVFLIGVFYLALYPFKDAVASASPQVGLQKPVPLVGNYVGEAALVAGTFFFFTLVRPYGRWSYVLAAATLPIMVLMQSRGMYIAVPGTIVFVWAVARARTGRQLRRGLGATLGAGLLALVLFFPLAPKEGRVGEVSPAFVITQLSTLAGKEGPGSPVSLRKEWLGLVLKKVDDTPWAWAVGVGLGPDLAFGFESAAGLVRKPHNDYLEAYARLGLLGLALFIGLLVSAFVLVVRGARSAQGVQSRFMWFVIAQSLVLMVIAATQPLLAFSYGTVPLFFMLGAALAVAAGRDGRLPMQHSATHPSNPFA